MNKFAYYPNINLRNFPIQTYQNDQIFIDNEQKVNEKLEKIYKDGCENLDCLLDFDNTITTNVFNGKPVDAAFSMFFNSQSISQSYKEKGQQLYKQYHAYEHSQELDYKSKKKLMEEWWQKTFEIIIQENLTTQHLQSIINESNLAFRSYFDYFYNFCKQNNINFMVVSGGISDVIHYSMQQFQPSQELKIFSNKMIYKDDKVLNFDQHNIVHCINKKHILKNNKDLKKNVFLFGDAITDLLMTKFLNYEYQISFGFFNQSSKINIEEYKKHFDIVISNNGGFKYPLEFIRKCLQTKQ